MLSKSQARVFFLGGTALFSTIFLALSFDTMRQIPTLTRQHEITESVARGKAVWEANNCMGCHTLFGEGAYYAPELGNVIQRRGGDFVKTWMKSMPTNAPGRRQMPQFHLNDQQLDDLVKFLEWTGKIDTNQWPPNIQG